MQNYWHQPNIDPVLIHLWGPLQIRWYSLLYVGGFLVGRTVLKRLSKDPRFRFTAEQMEQLILWLLVGAVVGARIIYCLVYDPWSLASDPLYLFQTYRGGLSFHGGLIGVAVASWIFCQKHRIPFLNLADAMAIAACPGLAMGRIGNFINGELFGRVTDVPWAVIFKDGGPMPRHPSQLYEGFLEGIALWAALWYVKKRSQRDGTVVLTFVIGYTICRFVAEFFREPDAHLGFIAFGLSMGQLLSIAMLIGAGALYWFVYGRPEPVAQGLTKKKKKKKSKD